MTLPEFLLACTAEDESALADLDLLDDARRHATCDRCHPAQVGLSVPFTAWCGRRAIWLYTPEWNDAATPPLDACDDCIDSPTCAVCGWDGRS